MSTFDELCDSTRQNLDSAKETATFGNDEELLSQAIAQSQMGNNASAERNFRKLIRSEPRNPSGHLNLAVCLIRQHRTAEAKIHLAEALRLDPQYVVALRTMGGLLRGAGEFAEAEKYLKRAIATDCSDAASFTDLGLVLNDMRRHSEAVQVLRQATRLDPSRIEAYNNLAVALMFLGRLREARRTLEKALRIDPRFAAAHGNLGNVLQAAGRLEESLACFDQALALDPDSKTTRWNRSLTLLQLERFKEGWAEYEMRWLKPGAARMAKFSYEIWKGESLEGRTILIHAEQGLGDAIQFIRYGTLLKQRGARVIFASPSPLSRVLTSCTLFDQIVSETEPVPTCDFHAPLMSLPLICQTEGDFCSTNLIPYLKPDVQLVRKWAPRVIANSSKSDVRVGIVWQGNPHHAWDKFRSIRLEEFSPLTALSSVRFVSIQTGPGSEQLDDWNRISSGHPVSVINEPGESLDLADIAAVMESLDLVITVDTATAHLAGALGVRTWIALGAINDWRWFSRPCDTPWYPSARLFRQKQLGNWAGVFQEMLVELSTIIRRRMENKP